jgi:two-component system, chemotaxis family, protein-glutamate methylesterase/glutaminase
MQRRQLQIGERIRVLVVDDSVVVRRVVTQALEQDPMLQVVATASNGSLGLQRIAQFDPHVITLDIEMPEMNGLDMLRCIRRDHPSLRVIMLSTLTERGAAITLEALTLGADDYVTKSSGDRSSGQSITQLKDALIPRIKQFFCVGPANEEPRPQVAPMPGRAREYPESPVDIRVQPQAIVIGVSTGGPTALSAILPQLPADFPLPVLIVQHMPPLFTRLLAERLNAQCALHVEEATQDAAVLPGKVLIAPGDFHMQVVRNGARRCVSLNQSAHQNFCRPAVDVLFRSAVESYGGAVVAVVLTGMGQDGLRGVEALKANGASVLAQDEASSTVWGMPGAVANAGLADHILPLSEVVPEILRLTSCGQEKRI